MVLIFRYMYSVKEVWGPFRDEEAAKPALESIMKENGGNPNYDPKYLVIAPIDHPTEVELL